MLHRVPTAHLLTGGVLLFTLGGCATGLSEGNAPSQETAEETAEETAAVETKATGQLELRANGEDFVRQGFVSKDGWQIDFDHVYVTLSDAAAYQSDPPYAAGAAEQPTGPMTVIAPAPVTVDLAEGDATAPTVLVATVKAPVGRYNALAWTMVPAPTGPSEGYSLFVQGTAAKAQETIPFVLKFDSALEFVCGDYVGDERKGILDADDTAELEATFHFDHIFGDGDASADDDINVGALGFEPLAAIAVDQRLEADTALLESELSPADYEQLIGLLPSLGHVGEGHCVETDLTNRL